MKEEKYEATEEDCQRAELAAHKIAPLFQLFQWQWFKAGVFYTPTVEHITEEFVRLIVDRQNSESESLECGRLGIKNDIVGAEYQLYLTL
jgi:hypothetical protein